MKQPKEIDWKKTNVSEIGSEADKNARKKAAEKEEAWKSAGKNDGLTIWRIKKFKLESIDKKGYGKFFKGDSYIILNTKSDKNGKSHDIHYWIGMQSTQDEYGTAAYKSVELSDYLPESTKLYREVQGEESDTFKNYFKEIIIMHGGVQSGFKHVIPENERYQPALLVYGEFNFGKNFVQKSFNEIAFPESLDKLKDDKVYLIDNGLTLYQYYGKNSKNAERTKAAQFVQNIKSQRGKAENVVCDQGSITDSEKNSINTIFKANSKTEENKKKMQEQKQNFDSKANITIYKLVNSNWDPTPVHNNPQKPDLTKFDSSTMYLCDLRKLVVVWVGKDYKPKLTHNDLIPMAEGYMNSHQYPKRNIIVIFEKIKEDKNLFDEISKTLK